MSTSSETQSVTEDAAQSSPAGIHATTSVAAPVAQVWEHLISPSGTEALLGSGARLATKGEPWHNEDGAHGVLRSYHPLEQVRVSWHPSPDGPLSVVDLQLHDDGGATRVDLYHEGEGISEDSGGDKARWEAALQRFASSLTL